MARQYVPIFFDWLEVTEGISASGKGMLIDALVEYYKGDVDEVSMSKDCQVAFYRLKSKIDAFYDLKNARPAGEFHWNWNGGKTPANQRERSSGRYVEWRKQVFERDCFTCQICKKVGGELNAHHIKPWSTNQSLRFDVNNGITLCTECHKKVHKRGFKYAE